MCTKAGLRLHKFVSNNHEVTESIPKSEKAKNVKSQDLSFEDLPVDRALGIESSIESDEFQFRLVLKDRPLTRRGVLSTVASLFDPIGFLAPYVLVGKQILQEMCRDGADWDDPLPEPLCQKWESEIADEDGVKELSPDDPEVKTVHIKTTQVDTKNLLLDRMDRFSDWSRATRAVAVLRRVITQKRQEGGSSQSVTSPDERQKAEIIQMLQRQAFKKVIESLKKATTDVKGKVVKLVLSTS